MAAIDERHVEARLRELERRYVDALDARRMDEWLDCLAEDGSCYVVAADNEAMVRR